MFVWLCAGNKSYFIIKSHLTPKAVPVPHGDSISRSVHVPVLGAKGKNRSKTHIVKSFQAFLIAAWNCMFQEIQRYNILPLINYLISSS